MNLAIVPRQIGKKTPKTHSIDFGPKKLQYVQKTRSSSNAAAPDPEKKVPLCVIT